MATGNNARDYGVQLVHYLRKTITFEDTSATLVGELPAGALILQPASGAHVVTAFNDGTTDVVDIGIEGTADQFASALDVSSTGFKALDADGANMRVSAATKVYAVYTGGTGDATAGEAEIAIAYLPDNDG
jgi:hypothetical protein